jgi:hypothetical protein
LTFHGGFCGFSSLLILIFFHIFPPSLKIDEKNQLAEAQKNGLDPETREKVEKNHCSPFSRFGD